MKRILAGLAVVAALGSGNVLARSEENRLTTDFQDWIVGCDNARACTAIGLAAGDEAGGVGPHLYITRGAGPNDAPRVEIGVGFSEEADSLKNGDIIDILVEGPRPLRFNATLRQAGEYEIPQLALAATDTPRFMAALKDGTRVRLSHEATDLHAVSLSGSSAALRWVDDRQKRAGTVTALVARGPKPASAVPAAPPAPVVRLAPRLSQANLPTTLPAALRNRDDVKLCSEEYAIDDIRGPNIERLSDKDYLWQIPCGAGAYNFTALFIISHRDGSAARSPNFTPESPDQLVNGRYDPSTRLLKAFAKGRGVGDCGDEATWAWDGRAFRLIHHAVMETCMGVTSEHWVRLWRARTQ
ncbi:MAG: DUF1176 domain-containing protein [Caulobacter sp.]|nr:DUF1176 domain-containing protein [Caulobacter sp.]